MKCVRVSDPRRAPCARGGAAVAGDDALSRKRRIVWPSWLGGRLPNGSFAPRTRARPAAPL